MPLLLHDWAALPQEARDAAYDNTKAVANSAALIGERNTASARVRAAHPGALDIPYGDGEKAKIDLFPAAAYGAPCFVFIHGGYWQWNTRELFAMVVEGFAAKGWSVVIPGYPLAPDASLAQIVEQVGLALDWLQENGVHYGIAGPKVLAGWSAGGHLAAMHLAHPSIVAAIGISGIYDLAPIRDTYLNAALRLSEDEIATLSPLRLPVVKKPMAIAYGSKELPALVSDSVDLHALRAAAGAPGPLVPIEGADHFTILDELRQPDGALVRLASDLVAGHAS